MPTKLERALQRIPDIIKKFSEEDPRFAAYMRHGKKITPWKEDNVGPPATGIILVSLSMTGLSRSLRHERGGEAILICPTIVLLSDGGGISVTVFDPDHSAKCTRWSRRDEWLHLPEVLRIILMLGNRRLTRRTLFAFRRDRRNEHRRTDAVSRSR